jgi:two-component system nitrate/nitrite response regulator NarL
MGLALKPKLKVGIVENKRILRERLTRTISAQKDMVALFSLASFEPVELLKQASIVLTQMQYINAATAHELRQIKKPPKIILMNADSQQLDIANCFRSGVRGFVLKQSTTKILVSAIRMVAAGEWVVPAPIIANICRELVNRNDRIPDPGLIKNVQFTERERQLIPLVMEGLTNKEIAEKFRIAPFTVKTHIHHILKKLQFRKRMDLMTYSLKNRNFRSSDLLNTP